MKLFYARTRSMRENVGTRRQRVVLIMNADRVRVRVSEIMFFVRRQLTNWGWLVTGRRLEVSKPRHMTWNFSGLLLVGQFEAGRQPTHQPSTLTVSSTTNKSSQEDFCHQRELYESTHEARHHLSLQETVTHIEIKLRRWLQPLKNSTRLSALSMKAEGNQLVYLEFTYLYVL